MVNADVGEPLQAAVIYEEEIRELRQEIESLRAKVVHLRDLHESLAQAVSVPDSGVVTPGDSQSITSTAEPSAHESIAVAGMINGRFFLQSTDEKNRLQIGGRIQPRFEYERRENQENRSRFRFRRLRIDFSGHIIDESLTFRIMPEFRDNARLDTAFVNYRHSDAIQLRLGQYNVPFAWERDVSSSRHQFVERSSANNHFQWPGGGGKDIGITLHGQPHETIRYGFGVFGGQGQNLAGDETEGVLLSGRLTWSPLGDYPRAEALVAPVRGANLSFGTGAWHANKSAIRDWEPLQPGTQTANVSTATIDGHYQQDCIAIHASAFYQQVSLRDPGLPSYNGSGFTLQCGYLFLPERLFGAIRYSQATPNHSRREGKTRELLGALQLYHHGHRSKVHLEVGRIQIHTAAEWLDTDIARLQYQLLF